MRMFRQISLACFSVVPSASLRGFPVAGSSLSLAGLLLGRFNPTLYLGNMLGSWPPLLWPHEVPVVVGCVSASWIREENSPHGRWEAATPNARASWPSCQFLLQTVEECSAYDPVACDGRRKPEKVMLGLYDFKTLWPQSWKVSTNDLEQMIFSCLQKSMCSAAGCS